MLFINMYYVGGLKHSGRPTSLISSCNVVRMLFANCGSMSLQTLIKLLNFTKLFFPIKYRQKVERICAESFSPTSCS